MTHELILDIDPTGVKCAPTVLESLGCKQCEDDVGGAGLQLVGVCVGAPWAALSCVGEGLCQPRHGSEQHGVGATVTRWQALLSLKHQVHRLSTHVSNSTMS